MMKFHIFGAFLVSIMVLLMSTEVENIKRLMLNPIHSRIRIDDHFIRQTVSATFLQNDCQTVRCIDAVIKKWYCEDNRVTTTTTTTTEFPLEFSTLNPAEIPSETPIKTPTEIPINTPTKIPIETPAETSSTPQTTKEPSADLQTKLVNLQVSLMNEYNG